MLYKWYKMGKCSIKLAAKPGKSNHESGLAIDINDASNWKYYLERNNFKFYGPKDPVHFDSLKGNSIAGTNIYFSYLYVGTSVLAF